MLKDYNLLYLSVDLVFLFFLLTVLLKPIIQVKTIKEICFSRNIFLIKVIHHSLYLSNIYDESIKYSYRQFHA